MNSKTFTIAFALILVAVIVVTYFATLDSIQVNNYLKLRVYDMGSGCKNYFKLCTCLGQVTELEIYPPQYVCNGMEKCNDINITEC